jgi:hypothetical protein
MVRYLSDKQTFVHRLQDPESILPSAEAVEQGIRSAPGVTQVKRRDIPPTDSWSLYKGAIHEPGFAQFACRDAASAFAAVEAKETNDAGKQLRVYSSWMGRAPTETELSNARALIDRLCKALHEGVPSIPASSSSDDKFFMIKGH